MDSKSVKCESARPDIRLLICDLDNTLYDWVTFYAHSFEAMVSAAVDKFSIDRETLLDELRAIHQRHHNSEYPFALMEAPSVEARIGRLSRLEMLNRLRSIFEAFDVTRDRELRLYPGVFETLSRVTSVGTAVVGHTEASVPNANSRLRRLKIAGMFKALYAVGLNEASHPDPTWENRDPPYTIRLLSESERKPNPLVLLEICEEMKVKPCEALFVGDSISRDIGMARAAGVWSAWAKYGLSYSAEQWNKIVRVTHWAATDVARAEQATAHFGKAEADFVLGQRFDEIGNYVKFVP